MIRKIKWIVILLLLLYLVVFATANQQKIVINYFYGKPLFGYKPVAQKLVEQAIEEGKPAPEPTDPREVPLIVVIFGSAILGIILSSLGGTVERFKYGSQLRQKRKELNTEKKRLKTEAKDREKQKRLKEKEDKQRKKEQKNLEKTGRTDGVTSGDLPDKQPDNNQKKG